MISNLEHIKVFYYVAQSGSLTGAASLLHITQPAVSQSLKLLEAQTGVRLFQRVSKGIRLTKEGELLYSYVKPGYEQILLGEQKLRQMQNLELGEIHIGASDMTLSYYLLPYLERFHEKYPGIKVLVSNGPTPETVASLSAGHIDFGIVSSPFDAPSNIRSYPVREIEDIFVCGRKFLPYKNKTLDLHDLESLPIISLEENTSTRSCMDLFLKEHGVTLHPEFELATSDMIVQFALRNLGVGCVVRDFAEEYLKEGTLFELRFNTIIPPRHFCVITAENSPMPAAAKELLKMMEIDEDGTIAQ